MTLYEHPLKNAYIGGYYEYSYDFRNEEYLYTVLIELLRSPDYLKLITDSSLDHFKLREELNMQEKED
jgi:hypothetical protein